MLMFVLGVLGTMQTAGILSSLQMRVPDHILGRVMGFYSMTFGFLPFGGMQAGALASLITVPFAIGLGGLLVAAFATGSAFISSNVRKLVMKVPAV